MKLDMKAREHVRIAHDQRGAFTVYVANGYIHVTANRQEDAATTVTYDAPDVTGKQKAGTEAREER